MSCKQAFWIGIGTLLAAALAPACTHSLAFSDTSPIVITGTPPAPIAAPPAAAPQPKLTLPASPALPAEPKRVEVQQNQIVIHDKIQFELNKATIKPASYDLLDEIVTVVQNTPQIAHLSIEGHTDSTGNPAHNQRLSEQRAAAVQDYLVQHGISTDRVSSKGWGPNRPLADNATDAGRELNRRVELVILEQGPIVPTTGDPARTEPRLAPETRPAEGTEQAPSGGVL